MWRLIQLIIYGHIHKWKTLEKLKIYHPEHKPGDLPSGDRYIQQCEICGKVQKRNLY